jgi:hypothetical protein
MMKLVLLTIPTLNVVFAIPGDQQAEQRPDPHVESTSLYSVRGACGL